MKVFKVIWCQKKGDALSNSVFINHIKTFYHFTVEKLLSSPSPFKLFLFMKKMNVNELI